MSLSAASAPWLRILLLCGAHGETFVAQHTQGIFQQSFSATARGTTAYKGV